MESKNKLGLFSLTALVVGAMIGGGAFSLPSDMAASAGIGSVLVGWIITAIGIVALALSYQNLSLRKPELDGGIYSYARAGFGEFIGFNSAWGYWISAWLGNVAYATLLFGALSYFFPVFGKGNNLPSVIGASIILWTIHFLVLKGIKEASLVNLVTTIAKLVPIFVFIAVMIVAFHSEVFFRDFWGTSGQFSWSQVKDQVAGTMLVTLWVFIGVEGAVVLSGRARNRRDVGRATVIGLVGTAVIYILITILSFGVMSQAELAKLDTPSLAYVMERVVGSWGAAVINLGLVVSLLGALLGWTLLAAEIPYVAAGDHIFPKWLAKENKNGAPSASLWLTNGLIQLFIVIVLFAESTYQALYYMASTAILIPYLFSALYQLKIALKGDGYQADERRRKDIVYGIVATLYSVWLVYAAGMSNLLMTAVLYTPGILFYIRARREAKCRPFKTYETVIAVMLAAAAAVAVYLMSKGVIAP